MEELRMVKPSGECDEVRSEITDVNGALTSSIGSGLEKKYRSNYRILCAKKTFFNNCTKTTKKGIAKPFQGHDHCSSEKRLDSLSIRLKLDNWRLEECRSRIPVQHITTKSTFVYTAEDEYQGLENLRICSFITRSEVALLRELVLSAIHRLFNALKRPLKPQVPDIRLCRFFVDFQKFTNEFLLSATFKLGKLQSRETDNLCRDCGGLSWENRPLCVHQRALIQLGEIDRGLLRPGDFYFSLRQTLASTSNYIILTVVCIYKTCHGVKKRVAHESELENIFTMNWGHSSLTRIAPPTLSDEDLPHILQSHLVTVEQGVEKIEWKSVTKTWSCCCHIRSLQIPPLSDSSCYHGNDAEGIKVSSVQISSGSEHHPQIRVIDCATTDVDCGNDVIKTGESKRFLTDFQHDSENIEFPEVPLFTCQKEKSNDSYHDNHLDLPVEYNDDHHDKLLILTTNSGDGNHEKALSQTTKRDNSYHDNTLSQPTSISEVEGKLLDSEIAVLPGSRDVTGRSVVVIDLSRWQRHSEITALQVALLLMYLHTIPKKELSCRGFLVMVDSRQASDVYVTLLDEAFCYMQHKLITTEETLNTFIKKEQLLPQINGSYAYDHQEWVNFRKCVEPFINGCRICGRHLVSIMQEFRISRLPTSAISANRLIEQHKLIIGKTFQDVQMRHLEEEGDTILKEIDSFRKNAPHNADYRDSMDIGAALYSELRRVARKLAKLQEKRLEKLETYLHLKTFEEESNQVIGWLCREGQETLDRYKRMTDSLATVKEHEELDSYKRMTNSLATVKEHEELDSYKRMTNPLATVKEHEREFEKFYFLAMRQIEKGNDLMEEASTLESPSAPHIAGHRDIQAMTTSLTKHLHNFTARLEDTQERLEDSAKCFSLLDRAYEWALETMKFVSSLKADKTTNRKELIHLTKALQDYIDSNPPITEETFQEMIDLATRLENESLLDQCKTAQARCQDTIDLIQTRQATLMRAKEQMELESLQWSSHLPIGSRASHPSTVHSQYSLIPQCTSTPIKRNPGFSCQRSTSNYSFPVGSYTSFPSNHPSGPAMMDSFQLDHYMEEKEEQLLSQGLITDDLTTQGPVATISRSKLEARASISNLKEAPPGGVIKSHNGGSFVGLKDKIIGGIVAGAASIHNSAKDGHFYHRPIRKLMRHSQMWQPGEANTWHSRSDSQSSVSPNLQQVVCDKDKKYERKDAGGSTKARDAKSFPQPCDGPVPVNSHLTKTLSFRSSQRGGRGAEKQPKTTKQLMLIMREMIQTEKDYVRSLEYIIENYIPELLREDIPQALRGQRNVVFGNIEKIFEFHKHHFLSELEKCDPSPFLVGQCFLKYETHFYLYALYNKNKPKSDSLMVEYGNSFFRNKQLELGDKMDLSSYLLKPVQRMGKYVLLLKQLLKECPEKNSEFQDLKAAEEMVHFQLCHGNDLLAMDSLRDCDVNLKEQGRLLRQGEFIVWQGRSRKSLRHVFLFEDLILFSKARKDFSQNSHDVYQYKHSIKTSDIGMTERVGESINKFEIWFRKRKLNDTYVLQAPSSDVKAVWVQEISKLLWRQALRNREMRLAEMSSMGIGNKPCLDIKPSDNQINDRLVAIQQNHRVPRFRSSIAMPPCDQLRNNKRPHSIISVSSASSSGSSQSSYTGYGAANLRFELPSSVEEDSIESGIGTDISMSSGDSSLDRSCHKKPERSDSILSNDSIITNLPTPGNYLFEEQLLEEPEETTTT
ncbi:puratrophin-1-like isoform X2 [Tachypleus tridentatus]|uniref:puratrophin-1-like isoform X2 n=1 Tax=Tachypleus tridentatus TaxID=6853 RepID=UPI003FCF153F